MSATREATQTLRTAGQTVAFGLAPPVWVKVDWDSANCVVKRFKEGQMKAKKTSGAVISTSKAQRVLLLEGNRRRWIWENGDGNRYASRQAAEDAS